MTEPSEGSGQGPGPGSTRYVGLLTQVTANTMDEDYQAAADRREAAGEQRRERAREV